MPAPATRHVPPVVDPLQGHWPDVFKSAAKNILNILASMPWWVWVIVVLFLFVRFVLVPKKPRRCRR